MEGEPPASPSILLFRKGMRSVTGQSNAVRTAEKYLGSVAFSRKGLIDQLEYEGHSAADATHAVDHIDVDWYEQAALKAKQYLDSQSVSRSGLIEQLLYEGFTRAQSTRGRGLEDAVALSPCRPAATTGNTPLQRLLPPFQGCSAGSNPAGGISVRLVVASGMSARLRPSVT